MIRAIIAADDKWGIGKSGRLPWPHNTADLRWFRDCTIGHTVVMGRKTWESLPTQPLPKRRNIVISSNPIRKGALSCYIHWFKDNHEYLSDFNGSKDFWIIGGARLIQGTIDMIDEIWISKISGDYGCDTFLPIDVINEKFTSIADDQTEDLRVIKFIRR